MNTRLLLLVGLLAASHGGARLQSNWQAVAAWLETDLIAASAQDAPVVYTAEVEAVIHPVSAEYMIAVMDRADSAGAALTVFMLRTPGGLVDSTRDIVSRMIAAKTPVVIYVAPPGARAASAGFILTIAADVAAMAPGTHIGAAHPVSGGGSEMNETMSKKAAEDVAAYARTIAAGRQRNVELANLAVNESRAFTEQEALSASPPLVDVVASDLSQLLQQLDGRRVRRFEGGEVVLRTAGATMVPIEMTLRQRILSAVAHPNIAYLLLSLGMLGLTVELWNPGSILPGVVGGVCLLLGAFALQLLPVNYAGLLLMLFGLALFALEIKITSYGLLTVGGIVSLIFGSLMLMDAASPGLQVSLGVVLPVVLGFVGIGGLLVRLGIAAQRQPTVTGPGGMIGEVGTTMSAITPGTTGPVAVHGEIWSAVAEAPIDAGARVKVVGLKGLTLTVVKE
jgi:membrane-bound serine protease (ClpP class)